MWNCFRPEAQGVICGAVFLIAMFVFIPFPFYDKMLEADQFPFNEVWLVFYGTGINNVCLRVFIA